MANSILVTVTLPTTRSDGTAVPAGSVSEVDILRAIVTGGVAGPFTALASVTANLGGPTVTYVDNTVVAGVTYEYESDCVDTQSPPVVGATSAPTPAVSVPLALAPLSAPTVQAVLQ